MKTWKVGIVHDTSGRSLGDHGTHLAFTGLPDVELALTDSNTEQLDQRMRAIGAVRHYRDHRRMLADEALDILVVCSRSPGDHFEVLQAGIERGCHIYCEKPLTADLEEADTLVRLSETRGVKVAVAHLARHALVFRSLKKHLDAGAIGAPLAFYGNAEGGCARRRRGPDGARDRQFSDIANGPLRASLESVLAGSFPLAGAARCAVGTPRRPPSRSGALRGDCCSPAFNTLAASAVSSRAGATCSTAGTSAWGSPLRGPGARCGSALTTSGSC